MSIIRRIARPLLAAPMIQNGLDAARHPTPRLENAGPVLDRISEPLRLPSDRVQVIRAAGGISAGAGVLLSLGRLPRLSALAIAVTSPVVNPDSPFWLEKDPEARRTKRTALLKNLGLLGGVLLASVDTSGSPDLAWRSRRAARKARRAAAAATQAASDAASRTTGSATGSVRSARSAVEVSAKQARRRARKAASKIAA
jgi:putative oxidoreductase